ncbi:MAG: WD40 repeat domain-containing protein [Desmonostoc vinosum HA7617-LM4]|jgi:WD40 repeat protein|nr:WD40 repeat domain-containing protein [Desmonostoc vinosum HA7617-LM4]
MKPNLIAFMILLVVQLILWKGISIISPTASQNSNTQATNKNSNLPIASRGTDVLQTTLKGHALAVSSVAIASDNNTVISGSEDNTIKIWNLETSKLKRTLTGHTGVVNYLSVTPDGKYIASAESKNVKIWNLQTGALIRDIRNPSGTINFIETSQDGQSLILDGGTKIIKNPVVDQSVYSSEPETTKYIINIFNLKTGTLKNQLVHNNLLTEVKISQSGNILVSGDKAGKLNIWNLRNGSLKKTLTGHENEIRSIAISPDEKTIVSTDKDGKIKIWDLTSGKLKSTFTGHETKSYTDDFVIVLIPDNNTLVSWNTNTSTLNKNNIKIWNLQTGEFQYTIEIAQEKNSYYNNNFDLVKISSDSKKIITNSKSGIQTWELATGQLKNTIKVSGNILAFSPDNKILAVIGEDSNINIWRIPSINK